MSNLLKDASILLTPTAYENGRMNAIKPYKDLYGPELVTNGDFSSGTSPFQAYQCNIANVNNTLVATATTANDSRVRQAITTVAGKKYKITADLLSLSGSKVGVNNHNGNSFSYGVNDNDERTTSGKFVLYFVAESTTTSIIFKMFDASAGESFSIDNVSVVEDLSGDFTFSRGSAATRVNAQGLVENVQIISDELVSNGNFSQIGTEEVLNGNFSQEGSELVTNGDFATDSDWILTSGTSISNNKLNVSESSYVFFARQTNVVTIGKQYKVTFDVDIQGGNGVIVYLSDASAFAIVQTSGTHTFYLTADGTQIRFRSYDQGFIGSIDNVSVKEVGQNWDFGGDWTVGENKIIHPAGSSPQYATQDNVLTIGKNYTYSVELLTGNGSNFAQLYVEGVGAIAAFTNGAGVYTGSFTASGTNIQIRAVNADIDVEVTNISIKEVGQDWIFGTGWSMGDGYAFTDGTINQSLEQNNVATVGKKYRISFDITRLTSGVIDGRVRLNSIGRLSFSDEGSYSADIIADGSNLRVTSLSGNVASWSIDNISAKEITDDTDLPRINYEGFSYQDVLGSEEVVNGDFSNGNSNWIVFTAATFVNSTVIFSNDSRIGQYNVGTVNVNYDIVIDIVNVSDDGIKILVGNSNTFLQFSVSDIVSNNNKIIIKNEPFLGSGHLFIYSQSTNTNATIDNVSVKEVLGQEAVPDSGCGSWLLEPQSTNLITDSSDLTPWWSESGATTENTSIVSPDGTQNVKSVKTSSTGSYQGIFRTEVSAFADKTLTLSAFAKKSNNDYIFFYNIGGVQGNQGVWFNISDGTIGTNSNGWTNTKIENYGNGWYRCSSTVTFAASGQDYIYIQNSNSDNNINSDINKETYIWGTQLEEQSYVTSYIPTNGATNTRLQDIANNSGNSTLINSTEGVLYTEIAKLDVNASEGGVYLSEDSNNEIRLNFATNNRLNLFVNVGGVNQVYMDNSSFALSDYNKIAVKYKLNDYSVYVNGTKVYTDTSALVPSNLDELKFNNFYGKTKALAVYKEALTDANLRCLTYPNPVATTFDLDFDTIANDFTFTRGSEATFVNEQGLIQSTNQIGPELVTNRDFENGSTGWNLSGSNISIANGKGISTGSNFGAQFKQTILQTNKTYKLVFDIVDYTSGAIGLTANYYGEQNVFSSIGTHTAIFTSLNQTELRIYSENFVGSIDNVSVKEVITATNTPRIDYSTGAKAFLLEPQSTNLTPYSEDFSQSAWVKTGLNITSNSIASPSGEINADKWVEDTSNGAHNIRNNPNISVTNGAEYTMSIFAKAGERTGLRFANAAESSVEGRFDLSNGTVTFTGTNTTFVGIEDYGNGWYRCIISFVASTTIAQLNLRLMDGSALSYQGDGTSGLYAWGAQLEALSYATSYIPTSGASATRNQELCNNATPVINSEEGTLYAEISALANDGTIRRLCLSDGTSSQKVLITFSSTTNRIQFEVINSTNQFYKEYVSSDLLDFHKVAIKYKQNDFSVYVNGSKIHSSTSGNTPVGLSELSFDNGTGSQNFFGNTKGLKYYPKALADVQLEDLTTI